MQFHIGSYPIRELPGSTGHYDCVDAVVLNAYTKNFPLHDLEPIFMAIDAVKKKDIEARDIAKRLAKKRIKVAEPAEATPKAEVKKEE